MADIVFFQFSLKNLQELARQQRENNFQRGGGERENTVVRCIFENPTALVEVKTFHGNEDKTGAR